MSIANASDRSIQHDAATVAMRILFIAFLAAYALHGLEVTISNRHLYGDASYYLVGMLSGGDVVRLYSDFLRQFYYSRFVAFWLTQGPTVVALHAGAATVAAASFIYGSTFYFWKLLSLAASYWLLPERDKSFIVFPILGIVAGTINSELYLVTEVHISTAFFWPLLIALVWLPVPLTRLKTLALGAVIAATSFMYESMALLFLAPLGLLLWRLRRRGWDGTARARVWILATLLIAGTVVNWVAILFPRDPLNKDAFLGGLSRLLKDTLEGFATIHAGPVVSITFFLVAAAVLVTGGRTRSLIATLGAVCLASLPFVHFLIYRDFLYFRNSITDRGFSGLAVQFGLALLFLAAYRCRPFRKRIDTPWIAVLVGGLVVGQLSWHALATKAWIEASAALRQVLNTRTGPQFCPTLSREYAAALTVGLDRILCDWWVTPLSVLLAPDGQVRSLVLSADAFRPFDPLSPGVLPSMPFAPVNYDAYLKALADLNGPRRQGAIATTAAAGYADYVKSLPDASALKRGEMIGFTMSANGSVLIKSGFAPPESWGTWTNAERAVLSVCFRDGTGRSDGERLRFRVKPFVSDARPRLVVGIEAGGRRIDEWVFDNGEGFVDRIVRLPPEAVEGRCATLNFVMPGVVSPASLGISADPRKLGFALVEMRVE